MWSIKIRAAIMPIFFQPGWRTTVSLRPQQRRPIKIVEALQA